MILLGSMALNAWLLLRHAASWRVRALPDGLALMLVILWGLQVVGAVLVALTPFNVATIVFGVALMVMSIVVFIAAIARRSPSRRRWRPRSRSDSPPTAGGSAGATWRLVVVAVVLGILGTVDRTRSPHCSCCWWWVCRGRGRSRRSDSCSARSVSGLRDRDRRTHAGRRRVQRGHGPQAADAARVPHSVRELVLHAPRHRRPQTTIRTFAPPPPPGDEMTNQPTPWTAPAVNPLRR